jgi:hypothetical protein
MAGVAQGLERLTVAQEAVGSRPIIRPIPPRTGMMSRGNKACRFLKPRSKD